MRTERQHIGGISFLENLAIFQKAGCFPYSLKHEGRYGGLFCFDHKRSDAGLL